MDIPDSLHKTNGCPRDSTFSAYVCTGMCTCGIRLTAGESDLPLHQKVHTSYRAHPVQWVQGALSMGVKRPWHDAEQGSKVKNREDTPPLYTHACKTWCLKVSTRILAQPNHGTDTRIIPHTHNMCYFCFYKTFHSQKS